MLRGGLLKFIDLHAGAFDIAYLGCLPNMTLMAAADEAELVHMVATAVAFDSGPIALRYPRGNGTGAPLPETPEILPIGKGRIVYSSSLRGGKADEAIQSATHNGTGLPRPSASQ